MPSLIWEPRAYDQRKVLDQTNTWNGHGFVLDDDRLTSLPPIITGSALAVAASHVAYWAGGGDMETAQGLLVTKFGAAYKLYEFPLGALGNEIALGGKTFSAVSAAQTIPVVGYDSQYAVIGASADLGLIDFNAGPPATYTAIAGTSYSNALVRHLNRIISGGSTTISWCVPGTITDWTTTASGAGSANIGDPVRGLKIVDNKIVVLSDRAMQFGYPTGTLNPVYRFERVQTNTDVCHDVNSVAQYQDLLFYKGRSSIYMLKDGKQINIGAPIWHLIKDYRLRIFRGIVTSRFELAGTGQRPKSSDMRYVLVPIRQSATTAAEMPILSYNIERDLWESFYLGAGVNADQAYVFVREAAADEGYGYLGYNNNLVSNHSTSTGNTSRTLSLKSPAINVEDHTRDYTSDSAYVWYTDTGEVTLNFTLTAMLNNTEQTSTKSFSIGTAGASGKIMKARIPVFGVTGQPFQAEISYSGTTTTPVCIHRVQVTMTDGGAFRG